MNDIIDTITVFELKEKMVNGDSFLLLDVREQDEYQEFNLNGKLIPLGDLESRLDELQSHKDSEIVVHCRSGKRSASAQYILQEAGFVDVKNLEGGALYWIEVFGAS